MAKTKTTLTPETRKELPARGMSKRTIILDAIRENALMGVKEDPSKSEHENRAVAEKAFFSHLLTKAASPDDKDSGLCLRLLTERCWSALKPSSELVQFEFSKDAPPHIQAAQVMEAIANGILQPDIGAMFVGGIKSMIDIETNTEIKERLEKIEAALNVS